MLIPFRNLVSAGGIVKRSLAMAFCGRGQTIAKACGLDDATRIGVAHYKEVNGNRCYMISFSRPPVLTPSAAEGNTLTVKPCG